MQHTSHVCKIPSSLDIYETLAMKVITFLVIIPLVKNVYLYRKIHSSQNSDFRNWKILENVLDITSTRSVTDCSIFCAETSNCLSCAYNINSGICILWNKDFINVATTAVEYEFGWKYYYMVRECDILEDACLDNSGYVYDPVTCFCYQYIGKSMLHGEAENECLSINGKLAKIDRELKQLKMEDYLSPVTDGEVWIDSMFDNITKTWRYTDGEEMTYFNWNTGDSQPQERDDELYIIIRKSRGYLWHDVFPHEHHSAICQIK